MKVIVDTNIVISSIVFESSVKEAFIAILPNPHVELILSPKIKSELRATIFRDKFLRIAGRHRISTMLDQYFRAAKEISANSSFRICRDPKDNIFLDLAYSAGADFIITGDNDLLNLDPFYRTRIVRLADFIKSHLPL